jgi:hypothetical protein
MKEGQTLLSNATDKFKSPLQGNDKISLRSTGNDYQKFKDNITHCSLRFGYQGLLNLVATRCMVIPAVLEIIADPTAVLPTVGVPAIPEEIIYSSEIKLLEVYSDKLLKNHSKACFAYLGRSKFHQSKPKSHSRAYSGRRSSNRCRKIDCHWKGHYSGTNPFQNICASSNGNAQQ